MPVLEAMACGATVLTTRRLALPEVGGDAVAYTEPDDVSIAAALRRLLADDAARALLGKAAQERATQFTWDRCARLHVEAYRAQAETRRNICVVVVTYSPGESLATFPLDPGGREPAPDARAARRQRFDGRHSARRRHQVRQRVARRDGPQSGVRRGRQSRRAGSDTELVLIANPDIVWSTGAIDTLAVAAARWPDAGAIGPLIRNTDGEVYPSARALPSLGRGIGHALCGWWWPSNPWTTAYRNERGAPQEGPVGWLSGSCLLVRRAAFDAVGGFDPDYFMYFEDVDLGERLGRAGWQSVYIPSAEVTHVGAHATAREPRRMATEHHRSAWRWVQRHYSGPWWAPVRLVLRTGLAGRAALARRAPAVAAGARPNRRLP